LGLPPVAKAFRINTNGMGILVDLETMKAAVKDPRTVKLDVRDVDEWIGESSSPYGKDFCPRKGRIPGAVWLEWYRMMKPTPSGPMFKSRAEILAECATVGITPETPVMVYCGLTSVMAHPSRALSEMHSSTERVSRSKGTKEVRRRNAYPPLQR